VIQSIDNRERLTSRVKPPFSVPSVFLNGPDSIRKRYYSPASLSTQEKSEQLRFE
jgi:hypothetical protein